MEARIHCCGLHFVGTLGPALGCTLWAPSGRTLWASWPAPTRWPEFTLLYSVALCGHGGHTLWASSPTPMGRVVLSRRKFYFRVLCDRAYWSCHTTANSILKRQYLLSRPPLTVSASPFYVIGLRHSVSLASQPTQVIRYKSLSPILNPTRLLAIMPAKNTSSPKHPLKSNGLR